MVQTSPLISENHGTTDRLINLAHLKIKSINKKTAELSCGLYPTVAPVLVTTIGK